jgi:hypothetical protein
VIFALTLKRKTPAPTGSPGSASFVTSALAARRSDAVSADSRGPAGKGRLALGLDHPPRLAQRDLEGQLLGLSVSASAQLSRSAAYRGSSLVKRAARSGAFSRASAEAAVALGASPEAEPLGVMLEPGVVPLPASRIAFSTAVGASGLGIGGRTRTATSSFTKAGCGFLPAASGGGGAASGVTAAGAAIGAWTAWTGASPTSATGTSLPGSDSTQVIASTGGGGACPPSLLLELPWRDPQGGERGRDQGVRDA